MADEQIKIKITGDASQYVREATKAAKATERLGDSVEVTEAKQDRLDKTTKKTTAAIDRAKSAAQALGGRYGELAGRAEAAAKAGGALGVAVGAAAVALTAGAAAATKMVTEAVNLTRHLGEITDRADELALIGAGLDEADVALVEDANDALDRLAGTFDRLLVTVAGSSGFVESMGDAADAVNGVILAVDNLENAQRPATKATMENVNGIRDFVLAYTGVTPALRAAGKAIELISDSTSDLVEAQKAAAEEAQNLAEIREDEIARINMENAVEAARGKIKEQSADKAIAATEKEFEARKAFYEAEDALFFKQQREQEEAEAAAAERRAEERAARLQARIDEAVFNEELLAQQTAAQKAAALERAQIMVDYAEQVDSIGQMLLQHEIDRQGDLEGKSLTTQRRVFRMQKAADLASATISTARAVTAALAYPPGPPGTIPMAALTGAAGAVQIGLIAAQQPSFHIGSRAGDLAPDEVRATLTRGEAVLTRQAQAALGLDTEGVASANAGISGEQTIVLQYQHDRISQRYHRDQQAMQTPGKIGRARKL